MSPSAARTQAESSRRTQGKFEFVKPAETVQGAVSSGALLRSLQPFGTREHFSRNETIFSEGARSDRVFKIIAGVVRICKHSLNGSRHISDFVFPGELIGLAAYSTQPFAAEAVIPVTVASFGKCHLDRLVETDAQVRAQLLSLVTASLLTSHRLQFLLGCQSAKERVASFLLRLAVRTHLGSGARLDLAMGRLDIADHLGLTIETVCRAISALKDEHIISVPGPHQVILSDLGALRALAIEA
jgi:CRP-like cAMP-binding protein